MRGNRGCKIVSWRPLKVYPRACGATWARQKTNSMATGLSPRMRGNCAAGGRSQRFTGSIPAHAGQPNLSPRMMSGIKVYPRVMRGNPQCSHNRSHFTGSIPAHAGQPRIALIFLGETRVYPRACGATFYKIYCPFGVMGLSPRMRGNRIRHQTQRPTLGSIPAHAGQPMNAVARRPTIKVYPRACGATPRGSSARLVNLGLSPRMRGNHC